MPSEDVQQNVQQNVSQRRRIEGYAVRLRWPESSKVPSDPYYRVALDSGLGRYTLRNDRGKIVLWGPSSAGGPIAVMRADGDDVLDRALDYAQADFEERLARMVVET